MLKRIRGVVLLGILVVISSQDIFADGCTGSTFTLTYSPVCGCVQFCSESSAGATIISDCNDFNSMVIDWGDGTPSVNVPLINGRADVFNLPCHAYAPGTYTAWLRIDGNCKGGIFQLPRDQNFCNIPQQVIVAPFPVNLDADFEADTVCKGLDMTFTNLSTFDPVLIDRQWTYDFGDGTVISGGGFSNANPTHVYNTCGAYDVTLIASATTVCCNDRLNDTIIKRVFVDCLPNEFSNDLGDVSTYIYESFGTAIIDTVCRGDSSSFTINETDSIVEWLWNFSNDLLNAQHDAKFLYGCSDENYNYGQLTLTNTRGCTNTEDFTVLVYCTISSAPLTANNLLCNGNDNGLISVSPQDGTLPYTYLWDPPGPNSPIAAGLSSGFYSLTITDANGCPFIIDSTEIIEPEFFAGTVSVINIECFGWATGTATLNISGGTNPNTIIWSNGDDSTSATNLLEGTYFVTATDVNGCFFEDTAIVTQPTEITATLTSTNTACGLCTGTATVVASGGTGNYTYLWDLNAGSQTTATATGLCSGVFNVQVQDSNVAFCSQSFAISIGDIGAETMILTGTNDVSCFGSCDGDATVSIPVCNSPPCTIEWFEAVFGSTIGQTGVTASNLCAGDYIAVGQNALGCQSFVNVTVGGPDELSGTLATQNISCPGICDGEITATITGGTPNYIYQWFSAGIQIGAGASPTITGLCAGSYRLVVTDANSCTDTFNTTIPDYALNTIITSNNINCNGQCIGSIAVTATGTFPPFTYQWLDAAGNPIIGETSLVIANLCAATYSVLVGDNNGCSFVSSPIIISEPALLNASTAVTDLLCFDDCSGTASVVATGGTPPYTYQWADSVFFQLQGVTTSTATGLCAGTYYVLVKDANSCSSPWIQAILDQPTPLQDSLVVTQPSCSVNGLGCIQTFASGGTPSYTYFWNTGATTADLCNIPLGSYSVTITDNNGCQVIDSADIITIPSLNLVSIEAFGWIVGGNQAVFDERCNGDSTVTVVVEIAGGVGPYIYLWNDPNQSTSTKIETADTIRQLPAGNYTVTVVDASGCFIEPNIIVTEPPPLSISNTSIDVACFGDTTGVINVTIGGGVADPLPPGYSTRWTVLGDFVVFSMDNPLTGIGAGQYVVAARDSYACAIRDTITILQADSFYSTIAIANATCSGVANADIDLTVLGGTPGTTPPYTYLWNNNATTEDLIGVSAATYSVIITDSVGCTLFDTVEVTEPTPMQIGIAINNLNCFNGNDGSIDLTISGGAIPYIYSWNNGGTFEDTIGLPAGTYQVTVTDFNGCTATNDTILTQPAFIVGSGPPLIRCIGDTVFVGGGFQTAAGTYLDTLQTVNLGCDSLHTTILSFVSQINLTQTAIICAGLSIQFGGNLVSQSGIYYDTLTNGGCDSIIELTLTVLPDIGLTALPEVDSIENGSSSNVQIFDNTNSVINYVWSPTASVNCATNTCSQVALSPVIDQDYTVIATDAGGCTDTILVQIFVLNSESNIEMPNAFSPNGDGDNDVFLVYNLQGWERFRLQIFDRWGEKLFESEDPTEGWDGYYKGTLMSPGVYVYYLDIIFESNNIPPNYIEKRKGSLTLVR